MGERCDSIDETSVRAVRVERCTRVGKRHLRVIMARKRRGKRKLRLAAARPNDVGLCSNYRELKYGAFCPASRGHHYPACIQVSRANLVKKLVFALLDISVVIA